MTPNRAETWAPQHTSIRERQLGTHVIGGLMGGLAGGVLVELVITALKGMLDFFAGQSTWLLIVIPLIGLTLTVIVLHVIGCPEGRQGSAWRTFPRGAIRADITGDVVDNAGREERFPWRLALLRLVAIFATVGSGGALGSEAPAAYLGVASGACIADRGRRWRRFVKPAALGGGAAGVSVLMGIPLMGAAYVLELGKRNGAPYSLERCIAALVGGGVGWVLNILWDVNLIRLVVPQEPPTGLTQAVIAIVCIGLLSGLITSLAASAISRAKKWQAPPWVRLSIGGLVLTADAVVLAMIAAPSVAFGPGGGAILWAETHAALPLTLVLVALLRAVSTTAATAAGGCGGIFVPFLAIGDIAGRVFAPGLGLGGDLAGAAGAAAGIAGGYRLPFTAIAMVLGVGGPPTATLTCLGVVAVAYLSNRLNPFEARKAPAAPQDIPPDADR